MGISFSRTANQGCPPLSQAPPGRLLNNRTSRVVGLFFSLGFSSSTLQSFGKLATASQGLKVALEHWLSES
jgi:hypothetical protein